MNPMTAMTGRKETAAPSAGRSVRADARTADIGPSARRTTAGISRPHRPSPRGIRITRLPIESVRCGVSSIESRFGDDAWPVRVGPYICTWCAARNHAAKPWTGECDRPKRKTPPRARCTPVSPITRFMATPITTSTANRSPAGAKRHGFQRVSRGNRQGSAVRVAFVWMLLSGRVGGRCGRADRGWCLRGPDLRAMTR